MTNAIASIRVGDVFDGTYEVVGCLGRGGMGAVFRAKHLRLPEQDVAIKVLLQRDQTSLARFQREALATSRLGHPNIVSVQDFNSLPDGTPYMVLEFLEGQDLAQRLRIGRYRLEDVDYLLRQICEGLSEAHAVGVVHRDLKPSNIFLCNSNGPGILPLIKILDFGVSKVVGAETLTNAADVIGTPRYMAPEQVTADNDLVGPATDIFALSLIVYEMLTGKPAFPVGSISEIAFSIVYDEPPLLRKYLPDLPKGVIRAVEAGLIKDPANRCDNAITFYEAFHAGVAGEDFAFKKSPSSDGALSKRPEWTSRRGVSSTRIPSTQTDKTVQEDASYTLVDDEVPTTVREDHALQEDVVSERVGGRRGIYLKATAALLAATAGAYIAWSAATDRAPRISELTTQGDRGIELQHKGEDEAALAELGAAVRRGDQRIAVLASLQSIFAPPDTQLAVVERGDIIDARLHPDGSEFLTLSRSGRVARYSDSAQETGTLVSGGADIAIYSPDGESIAIGWKKGPAKLYSITGTQLAEIGGRFDRVGWLASSHLVTSSRKESTSGESAVVTITQWDSESGNEGWSLEGPTTGASIKINVHDLAISLDGTKILLVDNTIRLIDVVTRTLRTVYPLANDDEAAPPESAALSPDARWVAVRTLLGKIILVDLESGSKAVVRESSALPPFAEETSIKFGSMVFNSMSSHLLVIEGGQGVIYPLVRAGRGAGTKPMLLGSATAAICSAQGPECAILDERGAISIWQLDTGRLLGRISGQGFHSLVGISEQRVLSLRNGMVYLHSVSLDLFDLSETFSKLQLSPDGTKAFVWDSVDDSHTAEVIDLGSGDVLLKPSRNSADKTGPAQFGRWIPGGGTLFDSENPQASADLSESLKILSASPSSPYFVVQDDSGVLKFLDATTKQTKPLTDSESTSAVNSWEQPVRWSADGRRVLLVRSAAGKPELRIVDTALRETIHRHSASNLGLLALSPTGVQLAAINELFLDIRDTGDPEVRRSFSLPGVPARMRYLSENELLFISRHSQSGVIDTNTGEWLPEWQVCELEDIHLPHGSPVGAALCSSGMVRVFEVATKTVLGDYGAGGKLDSIEVALSNDGSVLAVLSGKTLQRWQVLPDPVELLQRLAPEAPATPNQ